jgi:DnaJ-class molecular chaperone
MDHYSTLGVSRAASPEEIKSAYRKLAMKHHPDRGGEHDTFAKINQAYETLSDPSKKQQYDTPQHQEFNFNSSQFHGGNPFDDMFAQFGMRGGRQVPRNRDLNILVRVSLKDVVVGKSLIASYRLRSGKQETVEVDVPTGANDGDTVRYTGLGDDGDHRFARGDLYIKINVEHDTNWRREGDNLYTKKQVNLFDILLGCAILIETLDDRTVQLTIPKGSKPGTTFSISDYGITNMHTRKKGKILVQIEPIVPDMTDPILYSKLQELNDLIKKEK